MARNWINNIIKNKDVRPWDLLNSDIEKVSSEIKDYRMSICNSCPELINITKQCKKCGCFMELKTMLPNAECPIGKWQKVQ